MKEPLETKPSNVERAMAKQELIDALVAGCRSEDDLFGPEGVFTQLKGAVMGRLLEAETYRQARQRNPQRWSRNIRDCSPAPAVTLNPRRKSNEVASAA